MLRKIAFIQITFLIALLSFGSAQGCYSSELEFVVLFKLPPEQAKTANFSGRVRLYLKRNGWFRRHDKSQGFRAHVLESKTHPDLAGKFIEIPPIGETTCGPYVKAGQKGYIFGKISNSEIFEFAVAPETLTRHQYNEYFLKED